MKKDKILLSLLVFLIFFLLFLAAQFSLDYLIGKDAYYHIKHAWLIRKEGFDFSVRQFPWLQCSIIKELPADLWLGYHLLLIPFTFGDLVVGAKVSSAFFSALLAAGFFWVLKGFKVKLAFLGPFFLFLLSFLFNFRLLMARPYVLSIFFSLLGFYFIFKKKHWKAAAVAFVYAWTTTEAPLILFIAVSIAVLEYLNEKRIDLKTLGFVFAGFFAALFLRPDFPNNILLLYHQVFNVLFLKFSGVNLRFGAELGPFVGRTKDNILFFFTWLTPFLWVVIQSLRKKSKDVHFLLSVLFSFSSFFMVLTFLSKRFIEYWAPFSVLFFAVWLDRILVPGFYDFYRRLSKNKSPALVFDNETADNVWRAVYSFFRDVFIRIYNSYGRLLSGAVLFLIFYFSFYYILILPLIILDSSPQEFYSFEEVAIWLRENTESQSVVLNSVWSDFPLLFFHNHHNYYCGGMDPTFMYVNNPSLYWGWQNLLTKGVLCIEENCIGTESILSEGGAQRAYSFLSNEMNGDYILIRDASNKTLVRFLDSSFHFQKIFKRGKIEIYKIN
ncbi:MAG: hypothetical protein GF370_02380 [Candidatus Nealsonbacteria bacterium]|nr:hypothetical protein [Candidatus Nealsonbacteria bacterium]